MTGWYAAQRVAEGAVVGDPEVDEGDALHGQVDSYVDAERESGGEEERDRGVRFV